MSQMKACEADLPRFSQNSALFKQGVTRSMLTVPAQYYSVFSSVKLSQCKYG